MLVGTENYPPAGQWDRNCITRMSISDFKWRDDIAALLIEVTWPDVRFKDEQREENRPQEQENDRQADWAHQRSKKNSSSNW